MKKETPGNASERNMGIDLLRIIAMMMICIIHINWFTRAWFPTCIVSGKEYFYYVGVWTEAAGFIGVNLYAMITGYVCIYSKWRFARYLVLWAQVVFYTVGLLAFGVMLSYAGILPWVVGEHTWHRILLSVFVGSTYWYFAAYTALFFVMPYINQLLQGLTQKKFVLLLGALLVIMPYMNLGRSSVFYQGGMNALWLAVMYVAGAYVRMYPPRVNVPLVVGCAVLCSFQPLFCAVMGWPLYMHNCSFFMILYAFCIFLLLHGKSIQSSFWRRCISFAAPLSFGVYLIHVHPWSWRMLCEYVPRWNERLDYPWWIAVAGGCVLYLLGTCLDWVRFRLFAFFRIRDIAERVGSHSEQLLSRLVNKYF